MDNSSDNAVPPSPANPANADDAHSSTTNNLKITVATVTWNAGPLIARTIRSVEEQTLANVEHVIVDGNSSDDTLEQIHHYQERNSRANVRHEIACISEPDEGLYDAMNKAIEMATGNYIVFLNAGDTFHSSETLAQVAAAISASAVRPAAAYGDTDIVDNDGNFVRHRRLAPPERLTWRSFLNGMVVCHQAFFANTEIARAEHYDLRYRFSADFDWCIRIMREGSRRSMPLTNTHLTIADYLNEGLTTENHKASLRERFRIMTHHYGWIPAIGQHLWFALRAVIKK